jgi:hypothetical protein
MKTIFAMILLSGMLFLTIFTLDLFSGASIQTLIWKTINPFRVMEPAEYVIIFLFGLFFFIDIIGSYLNKNKDKDKDPSSN